MSFVRCAALTGLVFSFGCGTDSASDGVLPGFNLPPPPDNGMRVVSPPVRGLESGSNHEICTWTGIKMRT